MEGVTEAATTCSGGVVTAATSGGALVLSGGTIPANGSCTVTVTLALAVAIHSVPVSLLVWWLMAPVFGRIMPALTLIAMCAATVSGYWVGPELSSHLQPQGWAYFQALVAGSILHVAFGRPHSQHE